MITRKDYMDGRATFAEYYGEVARERGLSFRNHPRLAEFRAALANGDEHLNSIPLAWWDLQPIPPGIDRALRLRGDWLSPAGRVCLLKQAAIDAANEEVKP